LALDGIIVLLMRGVTVMGGLHLPQMLSERFLLRDVPG
jgi:hypothetical protein